MKTILLSLALGALFFAGCLRVVETRAQEVPRVVELSPPPAPEAPSEFITLEVEEPVEQYYVSRAYVGKKKPSVKKTIVVKRRDLGDNSFSRYAPLGLRALPKPPDPPRID